MEHRQLEEGQEEEKEECMGRTLLSMNLWIDWNADLTSLQDFEEEEEEKKKKEEEEAAANAGATNDFDDWGAFTSVGKKKKGKKEADIPPPPPEPVDLGASATADALGDDDWGFSTGKKKKDKKKGKVRSFFAFLTPCFALCTTVACDAKHCATRD